MALVQKKEERRKITAISKSRSTTKFISSASNIVSSDVILGNHSVIKKFTRNIFKFFPQFPQPSTITESPPVTSLPPCELPPSLFTGRQEILHQLHTALQKAACYETDILKRIVILVGLGGIGKSTTSRKYAHTFQTHHAKNIAWFNAETKESITASFLLLARHLKIATTPFQHTGQSINLMNNDRAVENLVRNVYRHFSTHVHQGLFIFDNCNQMKTNEDGFGIQDFLPKEALQKFPLFLLTSRNKIWGLEGNNIQIVELDRLGRDETAVFLRQALNLPPPSSDGDDGNEDERAILELGEILGGLPLALNLATASISEELKLKSSFKNPALSAIETETQQPMGTLSPSSADVVHEIKNYVQEFHQNGSWWLTYDAGGAGVLDSYDKIMATVWQGTMSKIKGRSDDCSKMAVELLHLVAFLPTDKISLEFCHFVHNNLKFNSITFAKFQLEGNVDTCAVRRAFSLLEKQSMLSIVPEESFMFFGCESRWSIRVHRLVQKWTREVLKMADDHKCLIRLAKYLMENCGNVQTIGGGGGFKYGGFVDWILKPLEECDWPHKSYREYLRLATGRLFKDRDQLSAYKKVYEFLKKEDVVKGKEKAGSENEKEQQIDLEYLTLCEMALIYFSHKNIQSKSTDGVEEREIFFDNSKIFLPTHPLYKIVPSKLFDWTLTQAQLYIENQLMQHFTTEIVYILRSRYDDDSLFFRSPVSVTCMPNFSEIFTKTGNGEKGNNNKNKKLVDWIKKYFESIQSLSKNDDGLHDPCDLTPNHVFRIACGQLGSKELALILIKTVNVRLDSVTDDSGWDDSYDPLEFLLKSLMCMGVLPDFVQGDERLLLARSHDKDRRFCIEFLQNGGVTLITKILHGLDVNDLGLECDLASTEQWEPMGIFEVIKVFSYFKDGAQLFLKSQKFMDILNAVLNNILTQAEKVELNPLSLSLVVSAWFALFTHSKMGNKFAPGNFVFAQFSKISPALCNGKWSSSINSQSDVRVLRTRRILAKFIIVNKNDKLIPPENPKCCELADLLQFQYDQLADGSDSLQIEE